VDGQFNGALLDPHPGIGFDVAGNRAADEYG